MYPEERYHHGGAFAAYLRDQALTAAARERELAAATAVDAAQPDIARYLRARGMREFLERYANALPRSRPTG